MPNEDLEKRIADLERKMTNMESQATLDPKVADAISQESPSAASAGYDGRFLINGKEIDYIDP